MKTTFIFWMIYKERKKIVEKTSFRSKMSKNMEWMVDGEIYSFFNIQGDGLRGRG